MTKKERTETILGIDKNLLFDFIIGIAIGVGIVLLGKIVGFIGAIGIPINLTITLDDVGKFIIIVMVAPICEEIFFRQFVLSFFDDKLENLGISLSFFLAAIFTAVAFSLFHMAAYGGSLKSAGGSFFSAALMGVVFAYEVKIFKSVLPSIMTHMVLNFSIMLSLVIIIT